MPWSCIRCGHVNPGHVGPCEECDDWRYDMTEDDLYGDYADDYDDMSDDEEAYDE